MVSKVPVFGNTWTCDGFNVKFFFHPFNSQINVAFVSAFEDDVGKLTKTIPQPVTIYYPKKPEPPLSPEAQASIQQAKFIQQQSQARQRQQQTQTNLMNGLGILGNFLPLLH